MKHLVWLLFLSSASPATASTVIWDYGPSSGTCAASYYNVSGVMYFADRIVFTSAMVVDGYVHFTNTAAPVGRSFEFRILEDDNGRPGRAIAVFSQTYSGKPVIESFGPHSLWRVEFKWAEPVSLGPGAYWFGASGDGFNALQATVNKPGDGQLAQFNNGIYTGMAYGDQLFQLYGYQDTSCPEPATALLFVAGALVASARRRRTRRAGQIPNRRTEAPSPPRLRTGRMLVQNRPSSLRRIL